MALELDDIALLDGPPLIRRTRRVADRGPYEFTRGHFVRVAVGTGVALGLSTLEMFPLTRPALAQHGAWVLHAGCSGLGSWVDNDNCDGCNQAKWCCCNSDGWHKGPSEDCNTKHRPDECHPATGADAWTWKYSGCCATGACTSRRDQVWRCSDGWYRSDCQCSWDRCGVRSVCRYKTSTGSPCAPGC